MTKKTEQVIPDNVKKHKAKESISLINLIYKEQHFSFLQKRSVRWARPCGL